MSKGFLILLFVPFVVLATKDNVISWQTFDRPPSSILRGPLKGQGWGDITIKTLANNMPEYRHAHVESTLARVLNDMQQGKQVCHPNLFVTPERKAFIYFSIPSSISPSIRFISNRDFINRHGLHSPVDLADILANPNFTATLSDKHSYGRDIDELLEAHTASEHIVRMPINSGITLFKLLAHQRVNYSLGYVQELNFYRQQGVPLDNLQTLRIKHARPYVMGSVGCAKTPWGKQVIDRINQVLLKKRYTPGFIDGIGRWWPEEVESQEYKDFIENEFLPSR